MTITMSDTTIIDADAHYLEPPMWFEEDYPELAEQIPPMTALERVVSDIFGELLPPMFAKDPAKLLPTGIAKNLEHIAAIVESGDQAALAEHLGDLRQGPVGYVAEDRVAWLDEKGIAAQVMLPTFGVHPYISAVRHGMRDLSFAALSAYNEWAARQVEGHTDRLIPAALIDLADVDWAVAEVRRMRAAGSRVAQVKCEPPNDKSLAHPDFDIFWATMDELEMAVMFHLQGGRPAYHPGWANTGGRQQDFFRTYLLETHRMAVWALSSLIHAGVLERHPNLHFFCSELGVFWVPGFCEALDSSVHNDLLKNRPGAEKDFTYSLPLLPSEYVQRQVRVTALTGLDNLQPTVERSPEGVIVFASDFPHREGSPDAIDIFDERLGTVDMATRTSFFGASAAQGLHL
ncbi:MAG: hypothetical protein JWR83_1954 [Aeromicrobium sp.]|nr:hypothetical protein [Aeromicrobium sp.]